jgi:pimeloyl-ACP methyl ester carboxylesterase
MEKATLDNMPAALKTGYLKLVQDTAHLQVMFNKDRKRMLTFKDWKDADMQSIQAPTLFILGDKDVVSTEHATAMSHLLPHAELKILPGEHGAFIGEVSTYKGDTKLIDTTVAIITTFLNK